MTETRLPLMVDAHQDLAWNALTFGRDYSRSARSTREREAGGPPVQHNGNTLLGLPDYLRGRVALVFGSLYVSPKSNSLGAWDTQAYGDAAEAHRLYAAQLDYYERLADEHHEFRRVRSRADLEAVLQSWEGPDPTVGLVTLMEGADGVREPKEAAWWMERGVRLIGPAWGATRYAGGTGRPGPFTPDGRRLLKEMADLGLILDLAHLSDEGCREALDQYEGVIVATHANPLALLPDFGRPERMLTDDVIRRLAERGGVIGLVPYNRFMDSTWKKGDPRGAVPLTRLVELIDHVCQVTGSPQHVGLGSDFDGGFGLEHVPAEIDTVADLQKLGPLLAGRGYRAAEVEHILGGNWIDVLRRGLPT